MARWVRIASVPGGEIQVRDTKDSEACLQEEMAVWEKRLLQVTGDRPDLIVTPECCDRPAGMSFDERRLYYQVRGERMREFFAEAARKFQTNIAYSAVRVMKDGSMRNAIQMISRTGEVIGAYHKNVLVVDEYRKGGILYGRDTEAVETDIGRICGAICFDLNFDEPMKRTAAQKPDIVLFPSNYPGGFMQNVWAYQTRSYFVSCVGYNQTANIINPVGRVVAENGNYFPYLTASVNLDYQVAHLDENWKRFEAMKKKYGPEVEMETPYGLGCTLLTYHGTETSMKDIVREFEIELWDDYYARSLAEREKPGRLEP